jgi:hypothetical protein
MWTWYRWLVLVSVSIALSATGAFLTQNVAAAIALYWIAGVVFVLAQTIPACALVRRVRAWCTQRATVRSSYAVELARWARLIDVHVRDRLSEGRDERAIVAEYERVIRPKIQAFYNEVRGLGCRRATTERLIIQVDSIADLEILASGLRSISERIDAKSPAARPE